MKGKSMKRWFIFTWCTVFLLLLAGCGADKTSDISKVEKQSMVDGTSITTDDNLAAADDTLSLDSTEEYVAKGQEQTDHIQVCIRIGKATLYADMYDTELAKEFAALLPQTISMQRVGGGREFYGSLDGNLNYDEADSQTTFENGEIAYWYSGNGLCLLYNNQVEEPEIASGIIVLGKITSDFSILSELENQIEVDVELKNKD